MNHGTVTGGVVKQGESAYTPPTAERASVRRVVFTIVVADSKGQRAFWNCEAEGDPATLDWIEAQTTPGRGIRLDYELATRPYIVRGVHKGEVRFLRVIKAEFMDRRPAVAEPAEEPAEVAP